MKPKRLGIEWEPGPAALEALRIAQGLYPHMKRPALIDKLLITGLHALRQPPWQPPQLWGNDRDAWELPKCLRE